MPGMREVERNVNEYAQASDKSIGRERDEANALLRTSGIMQDPTRLAKMEQELEATGVLPRIALREADNLDANHDDEITKEELQYITDHPDNYAPTTVLAAREAEKNWDKLANGYDYINKNDLESFAEEAEEKRTADPNQAFGTYGDSSSVGQDDVTAAKEQPDDGRQSSDDVCTAPPPSCENPEDYPRNRQRPNRRDDDRDYPDPGRDEYPSDRRPYEDADGPSCRDSRGDRGQRGRSNDDDPTIMEAQRGDGVWEIAKRACPEGASRAEVARMWAAILKENDMDRNTRLEVGQRVKLPPIYPARPASEDVDID